MSIEITRYPVLLVLLLFLFRNLKNISEKSKILKMDGVCVRNLKLVPFHNSHSATKSVGTVFEVINRCRTKFGTR